MYDAFPIAAPPALVQAVKPYADAVGLYTLPLHFHEVLFAFSLYTFVFIVVAPFLSTTFIGERYNKFTPRTRLSWNVHVVSFFQSIVITSISSYIIFFDEERKSWRGSENWEQRIWAYSGMSGLCQSFALGYFMWDLFMCSYHVKIFGWGMLAHAISATSVFALGYRPFVYFYCPVFLLYELSSPFLNIHWFCDKLDLTGSVYQAVNGALLTLTFFLCRICWGTFSSYKCALDFYAAIAAGHTQRHTGIIGEERKLSGGVDSGNVGLHYKSDAFMTEQYLPIWLLTTYFFANLTLNVLNFWWFSKMISTIRSRFPPPIGTKGTGHQVDHWEPGTREKVEQKAEELHKTGKGSVAAARLKAEEVLSSGVQVDGTPEIRRGVYADGHKSIEISGTTKTKSAARSRRKA